MFSLRYGKRQIVEEAQKISAGACVRKFLLDMDRKFNLNDEEEVKDVIQRIEAYTRINLKQEKGGEEVYSDPNKVKLTYTKSNLGKGFVFWFICNLCGRRVKHLYFPPNSEVLACRGCHRLAYDKQNESNGFHFNPLKIRQPL